MIQTRTIQVNKLRVQKRKDYLQLKSRLLALSAKIGIPTPVFTETAPYEQRYSFCTPEMDLWGIPPTVYAEQVFDVTIDLSDALKFKGWNLYARIDHSENLEIPVRVDDKIPTGYGLSYHQCDHCHTKRTRTRSYLLAGDDGKYMQVGSTCVKEFLGINPEQLLLVMKSLNPFMVDDSEFNDGSMFGGGSGKHKSRDSQMVLPLDAVWMLADAVIKEDGQYIKPEYSERDNARLNKGKATLDKVLDRLFEEVKNEHGVVVGKKLRPVPVNQALVDSIRKTFAEMVVKPSKIVRDFDVTYVDGRDGRVFDWHSAMVDNDGNEKNYSLGANNEIIYQSTEAVKTRLIDFFTSTKSTYEFSDEYDHPVYKGFDNYLVKLKELAQHDHIRKYETGLACASVNAYYKHLAKLAEPPSDWVGNVGEKLVLEVVLKGINFMDTQFGTQKIWKFQDDKGNKLVKFGAVNDKFIVGERTPDEIGTRYRFTAEIKQHYDYKGTKETTLGRLTKVQ